MQYTLEELKAFQKALNFVEQKPCMSFKEIKTLRLLLGHTQETFAKEIGASIQAVRAWEQDINQPGPLFRLMIEALVKKENPERHER